MALEENTGLQPSIGTSSGNSTPRNSRLARVAFILGAIGLLILVLPTLLVSLLKPMGSNFMVFITVVGIAMLVGLLLALVSFILGIIALMKIGRSDGMLKGKAWALSGLLMGLVPLLLIGGLISYGFVMAASASRAYAAKSFEPAQYKGETGSIVLPYKGESAMTLYGKGESIRLRTADGTFKAPAGGYTVSSYEVSSQDENNVKWTASTSPRSTSIVVKNGASAQLEIGPPFTASIDVKNRGDNQVSMTFNLKDKLGNSYTIANSAPSFQVMSQSGDILWQGKFQFG